MSDGLAKEKRIDICLQFPKGHRLHFSDPAECITDHLFAKIKNFRQLFFHHQPMHDSSNRAAGEFVDDPVGAEDAFGARLEKMLMVPHRIRAFHLQIREPMRRRPFDDPRSPVYRQKAVELQCVVEHEVIFDLNRPGREDGKFQPRRSDPRQILSVGEKLPSLFLARFYDEFAGEFVMHNLK